MKRIGVIVLLVLGVTVSFLFLWRTPAKAPQPHLTQTPELNIIVTSPKSGESVSNPITITGKARVFERTFQYRLRDSSGKVVLEQNAMTGGPDLPEYGTFSVKIPIPTSMSGSATIEVFEYSAKDGSVTNLVSVPVVIKPAGTAMVQAYFGSATYFGTDCAYVVPVTRTVVPTKEPAFIALIELLKGPAEAEAQKGATTVIPKGTRLNSLILRNGVAYADFDGTLDYDVAGSCRVTAIRAQIEKTLKQFPTIREVVISRWGHVDDVLQP